MGSVIDETYTIEGLIGRGGMGAVFLASHRRLAGKKVAIKMLLAELGGDEVLARFKREADIASTLDHPNIVKVENYNVLPDGTPYIAYEFLQGESLAQRLVAGPLPLEQVYSIIRGVGSALGAAHRAGIVHRDLKPQNIFLVQSEIAGDAVELAKVLDFGISKLRGSQTVKTQDSTLLGTPQYMAPEQATGQHASVDERSDIFALGAIVYEMVTGRPAFSGASIPEVVFKVVYEPAPPLEAAVPAHVADAISRAMAKAPAERFPTVSAFVEALTGMPLKLLTRTTIAPPIGTTEQKKVTANEAFAQTMGSDAGGRPPPMSPTVPTKPPGEPTAPRRRSPVLVAVLALGVAAIAGGAVFVAMSLRQGEPPQQQVAVAPPTTTPATTPPPTATTTTPTTTPPTTTTPATTPPPTATTTTPPTTTPPASTPPSPPMAPPPASPPPAHPPATTPPVDAAIAHHAAPPETEPDETGDAETASRLNQAENALRDKNMRKVESLANTVINSEHASDRQRAQAHALRGIVQCVDRADLEAAQIDLRSLSSYAQPRRRLLKECHAVGLFTDQQ